MKVRTLDSGSPEAVVRYKYDVNYIDEIGVNLNIPKNTAVTHNQKGFKVKFLTETVNLVIEVGDNYSIDVIMTEDAWNAVKSGEKIRFDTVDELKNKLQ